MNNEDSEEFFSKLQEFQNGLNIDSGENLSTFDFVKFIEDNSVRSLETFGPGKRTEGVLDHIKEELEEISEKPDDLTEWIDVLLLAINGASRMGFSALEIVERLQEKAEANKNRNWPDWRMAETGKPIKHIS